MNENNFLENYLNSFEQIRQWLKQRKKLIKISNPRGKLRKLITTISLYAYPSDVKLISANESNSFLFNLANSNEFSYIIPDCYA